MLCTRLLCPVHGRGVLVVAVVGAGKTSRPYKVPMVGRFVHAVDAAVAVAMLRHLSLEHAERWHKRCQAARHGPFHAL